MEARESGKEWNDVRILCEGSHIQIVVNGEKRVDCTGADARELLAQGFFGTPGHSGGASDIRWKNLRIKELP